MPDASSELKQPITTLEQSLQTVESRATAARLALEVLHEIRSPLEALGNLTYLAYEEASLPEKVQLYMRLAQEQVATLNRIAGQTLGFARSSPIPKATSVASLMKSAVRIHQNRIDTRKIHLIKDLPPENLVVEAYSGELLQVLSNLIGNALDALPVRGILRLRFQKRRSEVHFVVADSGQGIHPQHMEQVFAPFFTTKEETGTGLGLALSRKIVDHHRGRIRVRSSVRSGKSGTTFRVSIPA